MSRIILADDHTMFRSGLKSLIEKESDLKVVAEARNGEELLDLLKKVRCDFVVLDISMPNIDGITVLPEIKTRFPKIKVLMLTMQKDHEHFKLAMSQGANGYIFKDDAFEQLVLAIRMISKGKSFFSPSVANVVTDRFVRSLDEAQSPSLEVLTPRERDVLRQISLGLSNKKIAAKLKISIRTVETHRFHLMEKLGIKSVAGVVKFAISKGMV